MSKPHAVLVDRLRDLQYSLGEDLDWLTCHPHRADGLHDLGAGLIKRAAAVNAETLAKLPTTGWLPEAATHPGKPRDAH
jgi:hypothetical protein